MTTSSGTQQRRRRAEHQQVVNPDHHCNFSQIPHLLLDDAADGKLGGSAITLYLHYQRVSFELHGQPPAESLRETKRRTGLSNGTILTARSQLAKAGWVEIQERTEGEPVIVLLINRWDENCRGHAAQGGQNLTTPGRKPAAGGRKLTTANLEEPRIKTLEDIEDSLTPLSPKGGRGGDGEQDGAVVRKVDDSFQPALPRTAAVALPASSWHDPAEHLVAAFCRGLDSDLTSLTSGQRRSDLKLAQELHAAGATPAEAEAYARESNADSRRIAPVTLRSFARERQAWLQRRGRSEASGPRLVDRTGQPGSWSTVSPAERMVGDRLGTSAGAVARSIVGGAS